MKTNSQFCLKICETNHDSKMQAPILDFVKATVHSIIKEVKMSTRKKHQMRDTVHQKCVLDFFFCCNLSSGIALVVWYTTNGMYVKEQHHTYKWREQAITEWSWQCELYCCLLPQCEALRICRSRFPIATLWNRTTKLVSWCNQLILVANISMEKIWLFKSSVLILNIFCAFQTLISKLD